LQKLRATRRTTSFAGIKIIEESDEENEENWKPVEIETNPQQLKKNSSQLSLLSMSQASNGSSGFWKQSKVDKVRYFNKNL
jgi:hypothetical protein